MLCMPDNSAVDYINTQRCAKVTPHTSERNDSDGAFEDQITLIEH